MAERQVKLSEHEEWQSNIEGVIWVNKLDRRGEVTHEQVKPGGVVRLLPEERRMNQEQAAEQDLDVFTNGHLIPVRLVETADDFDRLKGNPNHMTAADMSVLVSNPKALKAKVAEVDNAATLRRLLDVANGPDSDAKVKDVRIIEERLVSVLHPEGDPTVVEIEQIDGERTAKATAAPKSPAPRNPAAGRR